jgi:hypothetical protein
MLPVSKVGWWVAKDMARRLRMATRRELKQAIGERYRAAGGWERRQILDEFTRVTGYHRKPALRVLNRPLLPRPPRPRPRIYDEAVRQALTLLWEAADRICGKRLKALLPVLIDSMERHGHLCLDPVVSSSLLDISAATIDRLLRSVREATGRGRRRRWGISSVPLAPQRWGLKRQAFNGFFEVRPLRLPCVPKG